MAFEGSSGSRVRSSVNITPLIDVVLVLLIIFMVMTPTTMKHLKPQIAQESREVAPGPQPVTVEATGGGYLVNGEKTQWSELFERVKARLGQSHQGVVFFKIDDDVGYGEAVRLFDLCRGAGAQVLALPPGTHG